MLVYRHLLFGPQHVFSQKIKVYLNSRFLASLEKLEELEVQSSTKQSLLLNDPFTNTTTLQFNTGPSTVNVSHPTQDTCLGFLPGFFRIWIFNPFTLLYISIDNYGKCHFNQPMSFLDIGFQCFYDLPIVFHVPQHQTPQLVINHKLSGPQTFVHTVPLPALPSLYTFADWNPTKSTRVKCLLGKPALMLA